MTYKNLDPLLHSQLRLAVMSFLVANGDTDFKQLQNETGATPGNLSIQLRKLEEAGYIQIEKTFKNNYQRTVVKITSKGLNAFEQYVDTLQQYISVKPQNNKENEN